MFLFQSDQGKNNVSKLLYCIHCYQRCSLHLRGEAEILQSSFYTSNWNVTWMLLLLRASGSKPNADKFIRRSSFQDSEEQLKRTPGFSLHSYNEPGVPSVKQFESPRGVSGLSEPFIFKTIRLRYVRHVTVGRLEIFSCRINAAKLLLFPFLMPSDAKRKRFQSYGCIEVEVSSKT